MGLVEKLPLDRRLRASRWWTYSQLLSAVFGLQADRRRTVQFDELADRLGRSWDEAHAAALELKGSGFFDSESQTIGLALTDTEYVGGHLSAQMSLFWQILRISRPFKMACSLASAVALVSSWLALNILWDVIKWIGARLHGDSHFLG